jgi:hypothetical protein
MAGLIAAELVGLALAYQVLLSQFECSQSGAQLSCDLLRSLVARAVVVVMAFGLFIWARPTAWRNAQEGVEAGSAVPGPRAGTASTWVWMAMHLSGVALLLVPALAGPAAATVSDDFFSRAWPLWAAGAVLATVGSLFWIASPSAWRRWLAAEGYSPVAVLGLVALGPDLGRMVLPVWEWQGLANVTFASVSFVLVALGATTYAEPANYIIGLDDFYIQVGPPCAGIEGFVLISGFVALYAYLFRRDLRFPRYWIVVLPLALALSWALNVVRISALLLIGAHVSPEIAVNGFHSYAGWMFFALIALALVAIVHATPYLHSSQGPAARLPLTEDWHAARILPFTVFLVTGTVGSALTLHPDLAFPARALALAAALALFWQHYRRLAFSRDAVALVAGLAVGAAWIATWPAGTATGSALLDALSALSGPMLMTWILARFLGTAILVPLVEELFFRGYLLTRLDIGGRFGPMMAVVLSSAAFAVLHGRWLEAWAAGVVFALVLLRRNRLGDAIVAHVAANSLIAVWALTTGDWTAL